MSNDLNKRILKEIEDHFNNLTVEQLDKNLIESGIEDIGSAQATGYKMISEEER